MPDSYADVVERLCGEFDGRVPLPMVTQIVRQCRRDASGSDCHFPADPTPRGLEGLARQRLQAAATRAARRLAAETEPPEARTPLPPRPGSAAPPPHRSR